jgi:hypothetical protein
MERFSEISPFPIMEKNAMKISEGTGKNRGFKNPRRPDISQIARTMQITTSWSST